MRNCLLYTPPAEIEAAKKKQTVAKESTKKSKKYRPVSQTTNSVTSQSTPPIAESDLPSHPSNPALEMASIAQTPTPSLPITTHPPHPPQNLMNPSTLSLNCLVLNPSNTRQFPENLTSILTPEPTTRPSLKRSRSSPTLSLRLYPPTQTPSLRLWPFLILPFPTLLIRSLFLKN